MDDDPEVRADSPSMVGAALLLAFALLLVAGTLLAWPSGGSRPGERLAAPRPDATSSARPTAAGSSAAAPVTPSARQAARRCSRQWR